MQKEKIYLDKEGYDNLLRKIEKFRKDLYENNKGRREAFDAGAGDGWDSPEFEEIERKERLILGNLKRCYDDLSRVVIIERQNNSDIVDIDDIVKVDMYFSEDDFEEQTFKLIGGTPDIDFSSEIQEVSINSPLGSAMYKKRVGENSSYTVDNREVTILIKEKLDLSNEEDKERKIIK